MAQAPEIVLRPGRERSVLRRHPWIFSGSVGETRGTLEPGVVALVRAADGTELGWAAVNPLNRLRARMWTFQPDQPVDGALVARRIEHAVARRAGLIHDTDAMRLVFSEADGVPGLIADRYGDTIVCQFTTAGVERFRDQIADVLAALEGVAHVYERSDTEARAREGLGERNGPLRGQEPPSQLVVSEGRWRFAVDVPGGHKTGFYLDQRDARRAIERLAPSRRVLNVFSYSGSFSVVAAGSGAASVTSVDSSTAAPALVARNAELNRVDVGAVVTADAFAELRALRDRAAKFDMIILDPPKLAPTEAHVERASRAYKDLNLLACKLLAPGGVLMTFSCSGGVSPELFTKIVAGAALDARRSARIVERLSQPGDHPVPLAFPEAAYLKGLVCLVE